MTITVLLPTTVPMPDTTPDGTRYEAYDPYQPAAGGAVGGRGAGRLGQPGPDAGRRRPPAAPAAVRAADVRGQRQRGAGRVRPGRPDRQRSRPARPPGGRARAGPHPGRRPPAAPRLPGPARPRVVHRDRRPAARAQPRRVQHPAPRPGDDLGLRQHRPDPGAAPHRARGHGDRGRPQRTTGGPRHGGGPGPDHRPAGPHRCADHDLAVDAGDHAGCSTRRRWPRSPGTPG